MASDLKYQSLDSSNKEVEDQRELNVIIFGESDVGKSALINQIHDKIIVESSNQAIGCTVENAKVSGTLKDYPHLKFNLYDTAGLSESEDGNLPTTKSFVQLIKLSYAIPGGIHLLICCHEKGRIATEQFKTNYRIFKEELCENRIPCLLVITKCDGDDPIDDWWFENEYIIRNQLHFNFIDGVCVSTIKTKKKKPDHILEDYIVSRYNLIEAIITYAVPEAIKIDSWSRRVIVAARSFYNSFTKWVSWLVHNKALLRPELVQMFIDLNYSSENARKETEKLLKELAEEDLLAPYQVIDG